VSYALKLALRAASRMKALPVEVQEAVFDLLDTLAANAASDRASDEEAVRKHVLVYRENVRVYEVFITTRTVHALRTLSVSSIWYIAKI
jgi:hypothetical protein